MKRMPDCEMRHAVAVLGLGLGRSRGSGQEAERAPLGSTLPSGRIMRRLPALYLLDGCYRRRPASSVTSMGRSGIGKLAFISC